MKTLNKPTQLRVKDTFKYDGLSFTAKNIEAKAGLYTISCENEDMVFIRQNEDIEIIVAQPQHTQGEWIILNNHPILDNPAIVLRSGFNENKKVETYKVICEFRDWRGDTFTALEDGEAEANARLVMDAMTALEQNKKKLELFEEIVYQLCECEKLLRPDTSPQANNVKETIKSLLKKAQEL